MRWWMKKIDDGEVQVPASAADEFESTGLFLRLVRPR